MVGIVCSTAPKQIARARGQDAEIGIAVAL